MAKLYFYYSHDERREVDAPAAGRAQLRRARHDARMLFTAKLDDRAGGKIASRIGIDVDAEHFDAATDFWERCLARKVHCILVDEAQFLSSEQVGNWPASWTRRTSP